MAVVGLNHHDKAFTIPVSGSKEKEAEVKFGSASSASLEPGNSLARIKLLDILPVYGTPSVEYVKAVEELCGGLSRRGAAIIELNSEDSALIRCGLESAKIYFRTKRRDADNNKEQRFLSESQVSSSNPDVNCKVSAGYVGAHEKESYYYRAGRRNVIGEEVDCPPACMEDVFRSMGRASRIVLGAICRHFQLRSDAFYSLLDDCPIHTNKSSESTLVATHFHSRISCLTSTMNDNGDNPEFEDGFLTLITSDSPGLQVCDANGLWYLADIALQKGDLLLLTGKGLQYMTAGLCYACGYRVVPLSSSSVPGSTRRVSLMFRLMPRADATLDGSIMREAGHSVSEDFGPIQFSKFIDDTSVSEFGVGSRIQTFKERKRHDSAEQTLRNLLSSTLTGATFEDAYTAADCGHTFGGETLKKVRETEICTSCGAAVHVESMIPNLALRAAALAYSKIAKTRKRHIVSRKRRKDMRENGERRKNLKAATLKVRRRRRSSLKNDDSSETAGAVQYPFSVNEKVLIKGNKRTPEKLVGREAVVTSKTPNGWYLLKMLDTEDEVRLQSRSLEPITESVNVTDVAEQSQASEHPDS